MDFSEKISFPEDPLFRTRMLRQRREVETQTIRETRRETTRETDRQTGQDQAKAGQDRTGQKETEKDRRMYGQTDGWTSRQTDKQTKTNVDNQASRRWIAWKGNPSSTSCWYSLGIRTSNRSSSISVTNFIATALITSSLSAILYRDAHPSVQLKKIKTCAPSEKPAICASLHSTLHN